MKAPESVLGRGAEAVAALGAGTPSGDARRGFLGTRATSTSSELFTFASAGMGAAALDTSGQVPKLVAVSTVEPFGVS